MKHVPLPGLLVIAALGWSGALADPAPSQTAPQTSSRNAFQAGVAAFQEDDLEQARQLLEQARESGLRSSALFYNLGVVYFRLGLYEQARTAFSLLLDGPHAPLARYNLGLVSQKQGDTERAEAWFIEAADESSPPEIQALAGRQLNSTASERPSSTTGVGFLSVATGFDTNISGAPSDASSDEAGAFGDLLASGRAYLNRGDGRAIRLQAVAFTRQYPSNADFDNVYLSAGVGWQQPLGAAQLVSDLTLSRFWFGGDQLEQRISLDAAYRLPDCLWPTQLGVDCELKAFTSTIQGGPGFSAYDGVLYGTAVELGKNLGLWRFDTSWRFERYRRDDLETAEEFFSLSPSRHRFALSAERQMTERLRLGAEQTYRSSGYDDPHRLVSDGQLITRTRDDDELGTRLFASYQLDERWQLGLELEWMDNQSTLDRYQYDRRELMVSLDGVF